MPSRWPPGTAGSPRGLHIARQRVSQRLGMLGVQVDLVVGAVQAEADGAVSLTAVEVIDEQGLYLLGHRFSISFTSLIISPGQPNLPARGN